MPHPYDPDLYTEAEGLNATIRIARAIMHNQSTQPHMPVETLIKALAKAVCELADERQTRPPGRTAA